jgi:uncharacterized protein (DUF1330 family)
MTCYVAVSLVPQDKDALEAYFKLGGPAVKKHGGAPIAGGPDKRLIEDNGSGPGIHVLLKFPDEGAVDAWMQDPDLADVHALRRQGARTTMTLLPAM